MSGRSRGSVLNGCLGAGVWLALIGPLLGCGVANLMGRILGSSSTAIIPSVCGAIIWFGGVLFAYWAFKDDTVSYSTSYSTDWSGPRKAVERVNHIPDGSAIRMTVWTDQDAIPIAWASPEEGSAPRVWMLDHTNPNAIPVYLPRPGDSSPVRVRLRLRSEIA